MLLELHGVTVRYGTAEAVSDVNLEIEAGSVVSIIGANGAGKSTIVKAITGVTPISGGRIDFDGQRVDGLPVDKIVARGIACVAEGRRLFPYMGVMENIKLGAYLRRDRAAVKADIDDVFGLFPRLKERRSQKAGSLSGGEQQMLAIARALMASPKLLLMDEPSLGLAPRVINDLAMTIAAINERGVSILLVEQNAGMVKKVAKKAYILEVGRVVAEGDMASLMESEAVRKAFVG